MAKSQPKKKEVDRKDVPDRDSFFDAAVQHSQNVFGSRKAYVVSDHHAKTFGLPLNNLALMWLIDMNIWPLSRMTFTHGQEQSGKSAFFYWLNKLYVTNGGTGNIVSTEQKDSSTLMDSLLGDERKYVKYHKADSTQDWQAVVTDCLRFYKGTVGSHSPYPLLVGVDSLQGVMDATVQEEILKQGFAPGRAYPVTAASTTYYLQAIMKELPGYAVGFHCVNHTKQKLQQAHEEKGESLTGASSRAAGASHMRFANSLDLWFVRKGDIKPTEGRPYKGFYVNIRVNKSSFGDAHRAIRAQLCWTPDPAAPGGQRTWWNWDATTAELIKGFKDATKGKHPIFDALKGFTESSNRYSCKALGLQGVEGHELGAALHADENILNQCVDALMIHRYNTFSPGCME